MPPATRATAPATTTPVSTEELSRGRLASSTATPRMTLATTMAMSVDPVLGRASSTRENVSTTRPMPRAARVGISTGYITWLRRRWLAAGSPVARSAQPCTIHSNSVTARMASPT